jgi:hypothetical protein
VSFHFVHTRIDMLAASARWPEADALILPTNDYLWMATGPALETKKIAGEDAELAAVRLGPIPVGDAVIATPGALPVSAIIHIAVMGQDLMVDGAAAAGAIERALALAAGKRWTKLIVHSLLATGRGTRPDTVRGHLAAMVNHCLDETPLRHVTLLVENDSERAILHEAIMRIVQEHR